MFSSGAPAGNLLMTGALYREPEEGPMVLHFGVPMNSPNVQIIPVWKTLGMRATGSHDVMIDGHVVPDAAVALKRKAGEWHLVFQTIAMIAFPLIYSVYLGVAESARDIALGAGAQAAAGSACHAAGGPDGDGAARRADGAERHAGRRPRQQAGAGDRPTRS